MKEVNKRNERSKSKSEISKRVCTGRYNSMKVFHSFETLLGKKILRGRDLNPWPQGYEPCELPCCSTPRRRDELRINV